MQKKDGRRALRLEKELRVAIGSFLLTGFKHSLPGIVSVPRVIASKDLKNAKVYISVMGEQRERELALETIQEYGHEIQHYIAQTLKLRFCPRLSFFIDDTSEHILRVEKLLHEISQSRKEKGES